MPTKLHRSTVTPLTPRPPRGNHRSVSRAPLSHPAVRGLFREPPPLRPGPFRAGIPVNPLSVPLLSELNIEIQGPKKSGKTSIVAGDERCRILKTPEGSSLARRAGKPGDATWWNMSVVPNLRVLDEALDETCEYAAKHGRNGDFNCVAIDSLRGLQQMVIGRTLRIHNEKRAREAEDKGVPFDEAETLADLRMYGTPYDAVVQYIERRLANVNAAGWGWRIVSHYDMRVEYKDGKPTTNKEWKSECNPSVAFMVSSLADVLMRCDKFASDGHVQYIIDFSTVETDRMGSRLPMGLEGVINVPDWDDPRTPPDYRAWSIVEQQYAKGAAQWVAEQARYHGLEEAAP